jgi:hypothetical protein
LILYIFRGGTLIANAQGIDGSGGTEICIGGCTPFLLSFSPTKMERRE